MPLPLVAIPPPKRHSLFDAALEARRALCVLEAPGAAPSECEMGAARHRVLTQLASVAQCLEAMAETGLLHTGLDAQRTMQTSALPARARRRVGGRDGRDARAAAADDRGQVVARAVPRRDARLGRARRGGARPPARAGRVPRAGGGARRRVARSPTRGWPGGSSDEWRRDAEGERWPRLPPAIVRSPLAPWGQRGAPGALRS